MKFIAILLLLSAPAFVLAHDTGRYGMGAQRTDTGAVLTTAGSTPVSTQVARTTARPGLLGRTPTQVNPLTGEEEVMTETDVENYGLI